MAARADKVRIMPIREIGGQGTLVTVRNRVVSSRFGLELQWDDGSTPDLRLGFEVRDGVPECRSVEWRATDVGPEIRASGLRVPFPLEDLLEIAVTMNAMTFVTEGEGDSQLTAMEPVETVKEARETLATMRVVRRDARKKITDALLHEVAETYRANLDGNPTQAVARRFGKAHRTAGLYIARARAKGLLGPTTPGKAGEEEA